MPFSIIRDEIARQSADAIIVPANPALAIDGGAGLAVGRVAGLAELQSACDAIGGCAIGHAVVTPAFGFPAKEIIHAVGPAWDGSDAARSSLEGAYASALSLAAELGARTIALALISSGAQGCPSSISLHIALSQVKQLLTKDPEVDIRIVVFDAPFSTTLLAIIDERGLEDAEVYKRANLSRQHFSKIRSNPSYQPTKRTVLALAVALELDLNETEDLLGRAGLAFSPASKADLIVRWFIMHDDFDIFAINEALYAYDQPTLG